MSQYKIRLSNDFKIIGKSYPQIQNLPHLYEESGERSIYNCDFISFPRLKPDLERLPMEKGTILTDGVSCSYLSRGLLISSKLKDVLVNYKLPTHAFYEASVIFNEREIKYYWFYFISNLRSQIDYTRSQFYVGRSIKLIQKTFQFNDETDLNNMVLKLRGNNQLLKPLKIVFNRPIPYDIYNIFEYDVNNMYISNDLAAEFIEKDITGIEVIEQPST